VLWKASGIKSTYDQPASEWAYLDVKQEVDIGKSKIEMRRKIASPLRTEVSSGESKATREMHFEKQPIYKTSTVSQLTKRSKLGMLEMPLTAKKHGLAGFRSEDLPSAFDDSDDDEVWKGKEGEKGSDFGDKERGVIFMMAHYYESFFPDGTSGTRAESGGCGG
jgi:hypothetical protein